MKLTVYRVENDQGRGPFQTGFSHLLDGTLREKWYHLNGRFPCPNRDNPTKRVLYEYDLVCACYSWTQLLDWFEDFIPALLAAGYTVNAYTVNLDDCIICDNQIMINTNKSEENLP